MIFSILSFLEGLMADKKHLQIEEEEDERNLNYKPPVQKSLEEIQELDKDDESLVKYKQTLLGQVLRAGVCIHCLPDLIEELVIHSGTYCYFSFNNTIHSI